MPALLIEVLSPSTWRNDFSLDKCPLRKPYGYLQVWQVSEYLVFDPRGEHLTTHCQGWRWRGSRIERWQPEEGGRYVSALGVSVAPDTFLLRDYGPDRAPLPFVDEQVELLAVEQAARLRAEWRVEAERRRAQAERVGRLESERRLEAMKAELRGLRGQDG